jgi:DNA-binding NtrC family response regulator
MHEILVVVADRGYRCRLGLVLEGAGYQVSAVASFDEAKRLVTRTSPDLVIADHRLGAYNGLHVLLRARSENPHVSAIVIAPADDPILAAEATWLNMDCVVKPQDPTDWLAIIAGTLGANNRHAVVGYPGSTSRAGLPQATA